MAERASEPVNSLLAPFKLPILLVAPLALCLGCRGNEPANVQDTQIAREGEFLISPGSLSGLVKKAAPAVVNIAVLQNAPSEQNPLLRDPFFRRYFDAPPEAAQPSLAAGSGVIVDGERGLVLTNHHVVANAQAIEVVLADRRRYAARAIGSDPATDIALLQIPARGLPALRLGDSDKAQVGDVVLAIGNPFGLGQAVTAGIVSALGRGLREGGYESYIQTDAPINPGNSGGPLIAMDGTVLGINSAIFGPGANVGIGFAVPATTARFVMEQILQYGAVRRGHIGVMLADSVSVARDGSAPPAGAVIAEVKPGSSADRAGLRGGDIVTGAMGQPTATATSLRDLVGRTEIGKTLTLRVQRGGETFEVAVRVEA